MRLLFILSIMFASSALLSGEPQPANPQAPLTLETLRERVKEFMVPLPAKTPDAERAQLMKDRSNALFPPKSLLVMDFVLVARRKWPGKSDKYSLELRYESGNKVQPKRYFSPGEGRFTETSNAVYEHTKRLKELVKIKAVIDSREAEKLSAGDKLTATVRYKYLAIQGDIKAPKWLEVEGEGEIVGILSDKLTFPAPEATATGAADEAGKRIAPECIGWTPFRHTFGSLLAQAGVSLDKISSWMGNTPEVCSKHYAQFVPRDYRDEDVDKLQ